VSNHSLARFAAVAALAVVSAGAFAQTALGVGSSVSVPIVAEPTLNIVDSKTTIFNSATISGTLTSIVAKTAATGDNLIFAWVVNSDHSSTSNIGRLTVDGWDGWTSAVAQHAPGHAVSPLNPADTANRTTSDVIGWNFFNAGNQSLLAGEQSYVLWSLSNATDYTSANAFLIDGSIASTDTFAPVPEPGTMLALGAGAAFLAARRRRKA
jgi:hypothetical protein